MATATGIDGVVKLDVNGGTVAVVGEVRSFSIETSADTIEDSVVGDSARTYKAGLESSTVSIECYWDGSDAPQLVLDGRADIDFEIYPTGTGTGRSEEHTSELQSRLHLVCRLLLEKKKSLGSCRC